MSFSRPTLADLVGRVRNDLLARLATDDVLRRSDTEVYARVVAAITHGLYGFIEYLADQIIYDTAEAAYLERWASIFGINRIAAAAASGSVSFTITAGAIVPAGTVLQALDGVQYQTTADSTGAAPTATAPIVAVIAAAAGNRTTGAPLTLTTAVAGVATTATAGTLSGGADIETDDSLRARLLTRIQQPPHGGAAYDYTAWALEVAGVTRAWVYPNELGLGTVTVRFVRDGDGTGAAIIPDGTEVAAVQAHIDAVRPVTAAVTVVAPTAVAIPFTITGLSPLTQAVKDAITASLTDLFVREAQPGGTLLLSHMREAISIAAGENDHVLTTPSANDVRATGDIAILGTITWA